MCLEREREREGECTDRERERERERWKVCAEREGLFFEIERECA